VAARDERHEDLVEYLVLADDALGDLRSEGSSGSEEPLAIRSLGIE
jgi:hypothetical protein